MLMMLCSSFSGSNTRGVTSFVTEPPKSLGPPTVVLVQRTLDNHVFAPDHLTSSVSEILTLPKSVSPFMQTLHRRYENAEAITITYLILK
jgi:hypothetical protein